MGQEGGVRKKGIEGETESWLVVEACAMLRSLHLGGTDEPAMDNFKVVNK